MTAKARIHFLLEDMIVEAPVDTAFDDIVNASGADVTFGCKNGTCGTCRIKVVDGAEHISAMEREEKDFLESLGSSTAERLGCQIKIKGDCKIEYIGL